MTNRKLKWIWYSSTSNNHPHRNSKQTVGITAAWTGNPADLQIL